MPSFECACLMWVANLIILRLFEQVFGPSSWVSRLYTLSIVLSRSDLVIIGAFSAPCFPGFPRVLSVFSGVCSCELILLEPFLASWSSGFPRALSVSPACAYHSKFLDLTVLLLLLFYLISSYFEVIIRLKLIAVWRVCTVIFDFLFWLSLFQYWSLGIVIYSPLVLVFQFITYNKHFQWVIYVNVTAFHRMAHPVLGLGSRATCWLCPIVQPAFWSIIRAT
jgi:hypothetical protein